MGDSEDKGQGRASRKGISGGRTECQSLFLVSTPEPRYNATPYFIPHQVAAVAHPTSTLLHVLFLTENAFSHTSACTPTLFFKKSSMINLISEVFSGSVGVNCHVFHLLIAV